jgi:hypothetical protein
VADNTNIEWTDATWNPMTGCTKASPGCQHCYAAQMAKRLRAMGQPKCVGGFNVALHPEELEKPLRWRKPRMVFVCSMGDLSHDDVPDEGARPRMVCRPRRGHPRARELSGYGIHRRLISPDGRTPKLGRGGPRGGPNRRGGPTRLRRAVWNFRTMLRRRRDSNPWCACTHGGFQIRCLRPLGHSSGCRAISASRAVPSSAVAMANTVHPRSDRAARWLHGTRSGGMFRGPRKEPLPEWHASPSKTVSS